MLVLPCAWAQSGAPRSADDPSDIHGAWGPTPMHRDARHGHEHDYPDRGAVVRDLPRGAAVVNYAGVSYRFSDGVWYEPRGPAFLVVAPAIGLVVTSLPPFATPVVSHGQTYLYANDIYYRPQPDLRGYEVVNAPADIDAPVTAALVSPPPAPAVIDSHATPVSSPPTAAPPTATAAIASTVPATPDFGDSSEPAMVHALADDGATAPSPAAQMAEAAPVTNAAAETTIAPPPEVAPPAAASTLAAAPVSTPTATPVAPAQIASAPLSPAPTTTPLPTLLPAAVVSSAPAVPSRVPGTSLYTYPRNGQSTEQQARDRYECYRFAVSQTGYDPLRSTAGVESSQSFNRRSDYQRGQDACFEGLGYSVR